MEQFSLFNIFCFIKVHSLNVFFFSSCWQSTTIFRHIVILIFYSFSFFDDLLCKQNCTRLDAAVCCFISGAKLCLCLTKRTPSFNGIKMCAQDHSYGGLMLCVPSIFGTSLVMDYISQFKFSITSLTLTHFSIQQFSISNDHVIRSKIIFAVGLQ